MEARKAHKLSRRDFLKSSSAAALTTGLGLSVGSAAAQEVKKVVSANEKIILGCIGLGGRGMGVMNGFMKYEDVEIGAVCDVCEERQNAAVEKTGGKAKAYKDFRELLEQKDIDAVVITTPLIGILLCQFMLAKLEKTSIAKSQFHAIRQRQLQWQKPLVIINE